PNGSCRAARASRSTRVTYRSLLVTPRSTQETSRTGASAGNPSTTSTCDAGASAGPRIASMRSTVHAPEMDPTKATLNGRLASPCSDARRARWIPQKVMVVRDPALRLTLKELYLPTWRPIYQGPLAHSHEGNHYAGGDRGAAHPVPGLERVELRWRLLDLSV